MYQVIIQDEYNNLLHVGFYKELKDSLKDVNAYLEMYDTKIDELNEYTSTFDTAFDTEVEVDEYGTCIMIRGFKFDKKELLHDIS